MNESIASCLYSKIQLSFCVRYVCYDGRLELSQKCIRDSAVVTYLSMDYC